MVRDAEAIEGALRVRGSLRGQIQRAVAFSLNVTCKRLTMASSHKTRRVARKGHRPYIQGINSAYRRNSRLGIAMCMCGGQNRPQLEHTHIYGLIGRQVCVDGAPRVDMPPRGKGKSLSHHTYTTYAYVTLACLFRHSEYFSPSLRPVNVPSGRVMPVMPRILHLCDTFITLQYKAGSCALQALSA